MNKKGVPKMKPKKQKEITKATEIAFGWECENCIKLESALVFSDMILEQIQRVVDGEEVSDFALSFPLIRDVADMKMMIDEANKH